ncbi:uncharacterized protein LOC143099505 [Alosa pseudoharengus]|uniref:uncharacterized protein LOC143099505 n=1 Tax=Alosa pseudoharengus TaxID=34774 RepID=UPI003F8BCDEA
MASLVTLFIAVNSDSVYKATEDVVSAFEVPTLSARKLNNYSSQPFLKPKISLFEVIVAKVWKCTLFRRHRPESYISQQTDIGGKGALKEVATQLNRTLKVQVGSVLPSILKDHWSIDECRDAILRWADELRDPLFKTATKLIDTSSSTDVNRKKILLNTNSKDLEDERFRQAQLTLQQWAEGLKALPEGSVCASEDVRCVLEDLDKQWKRGQLPNMLPALEIMRKTVLEKQQRAEVHSPVTWNNKLRSHYVGLGDAGVRPCPYTAMRYLTNEMSLSKHKTFSVSQSCQTVVIYVPKKQETRQTFSSQPFLKPKISLLKVLEECKVILQNHVLKKYKHFQLIDVSSLDESKVILKGLAIDLNGVKELIKLSALKDDEGENGGRRLKHAEEVKQSEMKGNIAGEIHNSDWQSVVISKVKVTLDPKTANPSLRPSKDGKRVRSLTFEESKETQHAWSQRAPHKYDGWFCIQGKEGFSSGQHYWEVGVGGSCDWRIGVLKESAPKHGFTKLTTSTGYWTLRLQLGSLVALTDPVTKLNQSSPTRVGVYLDMEGKQVRFFDVQKKRRRHIYTFHADFGNDEKIYPVFGTVDTVRELVIL